MILEGEHKLKLAADLHTHTIASTHAYATITEMVNEAAKQGLFAIAITDHAPAMPGGPGPYYFESLSILPQYLNGVRLIKGMEADIINYEGDIDCPQKLQSSLEWIVASMHTVTLSEEPSVEKCSEAYLKIAENPNVNVIAHSGSEWFKYDYEKVIPKLAKEGKLIEINDSAFRYKKESMPNCVQIAKVCKKYGARICVNTDSHFTHTVGRAYETLEMLEDIDFPEKLIVNAGVDTTKAYFREKNILY